MFAGKFRLSEEDDDFFGDVESTRSNLSNIFGVSPKQVQSSEDHSFKFNGTPKQEKVIDDSPKSGNTSSWNIQAAVVVTAFKLINREHISQGKVGFAVLKSPEGVFKVVLYRTKTSILCTLTLKEDTKFFLKNLYLQFHDDLNVFWSTLFEKEKADVILDLIKSKCIVEESVDANNTEADFDKKLNALVKNTESLEIKTDKQNPVNYSSDEHVKDTKAQILSRMAKMGQPLPKLVGTATTDISDSSDNETKARFLSKPVPVSRKPKIQQLVAASSISAQLTPTITTISSFPLNVAGDNQLLNMLFLENRTQNTEVRMNMSRMETKIERILDKIDTIEMKSGVVPKDQSMDDEILALEEKLLTLKKENKSLKVQIASMEEDSSSQKLEVPESINAENIKEFKELVEHFQIDVSQHSSLSHLLREIIERLKCAKESLNNSLDDCTKSLEDHKRQLKLQEEKNSCKIEELEKQKDAALAKVASLESRIEGLNTEKGKLVSNLEEVKSNSEKVLDKLVKEIMNNLYYKLTEQIQDGKLHSSDEILRICANAIKQETNNALRRRNEKDKKH